MINLTEVILRKVENGYIISEVRPPAERVEQWVCESDESLYAWVHNKFSIELEGSTDVKEDSQ